MIEPTFLTPPKKLSAKCMLLFKLSVGFVGNTVRWKLHTDEGLSAIASFPQVHTKEPRRGAGLRQGLELRSPAVAAEAEEHSSPEGQTQLC